jgi:hypothetical protein
MAPNRAAVELFSTRIPVDGWAGLPLLGAVGVLAMVLPGAALVLLAGVAGGTAIAAVLIRGHRTA